MRGNSKRIIVFTTAYRPLIGGSELALEENIRHLPDIFFDVITPRHDCEFVPFEMGSNYCIHRVGPEGALGKWLFPVTGFFTGLKLVRDKNYEAIHAYQASYGAGAAYFLKSYYRKLPFILTLQEGKVLETQGRLINWIRNKIISKADAITAISNYLADYAKKISPNAKIVLIPNGVDLKKFSLPAEKAQENLISDDKKPITIISVSRLVEKNGLADLIKAFKILKEAVPNAKLQILGDGPLRGELFCLAADLGIAGDVEFLGAIPHEETMKYLAGASVFVRPSLSEGLGTAFLEAMAAGLPVVATPVGGIPDFLKDGETGLSCQVGSPESIAEKIKEILTDSSLRNKLIVNGRNLVEEKYNWDKIAGEFKEIYYNIV